MQTDWDPMNRLPIYPDLAPGLACLQQMDQVLIQQKESQTSQKYEIRSVTGQKLFFAKDKRVPCGSTMKVKIVDNADREVLHLRLNSKLFSNKEVEVFSSNGALLGSIVKETHILKTRLAILNPDKVTVLKVHGPTIGKRSFENGNFMVKTTGGCMVVGGITKLWRGILKEMFSGNDHYSVYFPAQLDLKVKALLISAGLFIDYLYYESE